MRRSAPQSGATPWYQILVVARRPIAIAAAFLITAMAAAAPVRAQDPDAPPGASVRWLPCERWVMMHWIPFDERRLFGVLGITRDQAQAWMVDDVHHTFAQIARRRGLKPAGAARRLVDPWTRGRRPSERALLRERARRLLTNGHLSQHVFFHVFHHPDLGAHAERLYGLSPMRYLALRRAGYAPAEIATVGGRSRSGARAPDRR